MRVLNTRFNAVILPSWCSFNISIHCRNVGCSEIYVKHTASGQIEEKSDFKRGDCPHGSRQPIVRLALSMRQYVAPNSNPSCRAGGLTTQQWAVLGARFRTDVQEGESIGDVARYLMVSRQNLAELIRSIERNAHIGAAARRRDRRSRLVILTAAGMRVWIARTQPKIHAYYEQAVDGFSTTYLTHTLRFLLKLLGNIERLDEGGACFEIEIAVRTLLLRVSKNWLLIVCGS